MTSTTHEPARMPSPDPAGPDGELPPQWAAYLAALAAAVEEVEAALAGDRAPQLPPLPAPGGPAPHAVLARRDGLVDDLARISARLQERRDHLRGQLSLLAAPRPRAQADREVDLGADLDLLG